MSYVMCVRVVLSTDTVGADTFPFDLSTHVKMRAMKNVNNVELRMERAHAAGTDLRYIRK